MMSNSNSMKGVLAQLNTSKNFNKNKLYKWCKSFDFKPTESDKAAIKWEMRSFLREALGESLEDKYKVGQRIKVFWDAAVGQDVKWYVGKINNLRGAMAEIEWDGGHGVDELNLNHLYLEDPEE